MGDSTASVVHAVPTDRTVARSEYEELGAGTMMAIPGARQSVVSRHGCSSKQQDAPLLQPSARPPRSRRKSTASFSLCRSSAFLLYLATLLTFLPLSNAVFVNFDNCLERNYREQKNPVRLQFVPLYLNAIFNTTSKSHNLNITIYGDVAGQSVQGDYPPPDSPTWKDPTDPFGKIVNVSSTSNKYTTLFSDFKVLTYEAYRSEASAFCESTINEECPLKPAFGANKSNPAELPGFTIAHDFFSSYSFGTLASTMSIVTGDDSVQTLGCVSANITPDLGPTLADMLCYLPAAILAMVAISTVFAATCSPWGTSDIFRWSSLYGRDEDLIRLVTPGFGDCLQYIQFAVLAGSLNLQYPGFFQPVVSQASWSVLLFNESFVSHGNGTQSLVDGIYFANGTYGISRLGEYVGMSEEQDIWAGMAVWLLGLIGVVTLVTQLLFLTRWAWRAFTDAQGGDLRDKNWPFTAGNIVRLVFNYFMLPIISLSLFQMVVAPRSPASVVATAVLTLIGVVGFAAWIFWLIFTTRPRAHLFDDLPTVLTYGPLYNTYSDDAAPFAFIPVLLTTIRGIAIGAIQPSGIAQIIILAICEVILILTLNAFRPFQSNTSMNAYHTFFSSVRLVIILLMVAFVPSLGVTEAPKGWIGYAILLLHAMVLVFGFFLNSLQTIVEVVARMCGAGADQRGGLTKVFGKRQLSRRNHRYVRSSLNSDAAILTHDGEPKSVQLMGGRARSMSGSSAVLLNQQYSASNSQRASLGFDQFSQGGELQQVGVGPGTPGTGTVPWSQLGGGSGPSSRRPTMGGALENADPYYRPPRPRKQTMDSMTAANVVRRSGGSPDIDMIPYADNVDQAEAGDAEGGPSFSANRGSIRPAYLRTHRDDSDPALADRPDYSVRESDFYYGLRGPALSAQPSRRLKTGPADPMGPVSSATGWFKSLNLFGGAKKKEKGKGFEVVRSTRVPPQMMPLDEEEGESPEIPHEPYQDSPGTPPTRKSSKQTSPGVVAGAGMATRQPSDSESEESSLDEPFDSHVNRVSAMAPTLGPIETGGGIELPSRIGSRASKNTAPSRAPTIPRRSSRRTKSTDSAVLDTSSRLSTVMASPPGTPGRLSAHMPTHSGQHLHPHNNAVPIRLPFGSTDPSPSPERSPGHSAASSMYRQEGSSDMNRLSTGEQLVPPRRIPGTDDRPMSTGFVDVHMARDSIQNDEARNHLEASAEFVDRSRSISSLGSSRTRTR